MNQIVKWGIIGLGNIAYEFENAFNAPDNAQLTVLTSKSEEKPDEFGINFNIKKENLFNDYNEIIEDNNLSKDIIESKTQASFPGINKKNILLNSKIITDWINA